MNLTELQKEVGEWQRATFENSTDGLLEHLRREIDELEMEETPEELADCLILLCGLAEHNHFALEGGVIPIVGDLADALIQQISRFSYGRRLHARSMALMLIGYAALHGIDLLAEAHAKLQVNKQRTWGTPDEHGVIEHVR